MGGDVCWWLEEQEGNVRNERAKLFILVIWGKERSEEGFEGIGKDKNKRGNGNVH